MISEVEVLAWNPAKHEAISGVSTAGDIDARGGIVVEDQFGVAKSIHLDQYALDQKKADQMAVDILTQKTRDYVTGRGATYGNPEIRAGSIVKVEGIGAKFSGKYLILSALHKLIPLRGYKTSFTFTSPLGSPVQAGPGAETARQESVAAAAGTEGEEQEEQEKNPQIINLKWMKDGEEITQTNIGEEIILTADVTDIDDGMWIRLRIYESGYENEESHFHQESVQVNGGKIEVPWKVKFDEKTMQSKSDEELKKEGYPLPEYTFMMEGKQPKESSSGNSPNLALQMQIEIEFVNNKNKPIANEKFEVYDVNENKLYEDTVDEDGVARIPALGVYKIVIAFPEIKQPVELET